MGFCDVEGGVAGGVLMTEGPGWVLWGGGYRKQSCHCLNKLVYAACVSATLLFYLCKTTVLHKKEL